MSSRTAKVEPVEAEIIDPEGIFHIHFINVFPFALCSFVKYLILIMKTEPTVHVAWNGQGANE